MPFYDWNTKFIWRSGAAALALFAVALGPGCSSNKPARSESSESDSPAIAVESLRIPRVNGIQKAGSGSMTKAGGAWIANSNGGGEFAAGVPIWPFGKTDWKGTVEVRFQVTKGTIGIGITTPETKIVNEQVFGFDPKDQQVSFPVSSALNAHMLIIRGMASKGTMCEALVRSVDLVLSGAKIPGAVSLDKIAAAQPSASVYQGPPVRIVTAPDRYSYAAAVPLVLNDTHGLVIVRARGRVLRGQVGFGILNRSQRDFQYQTSILPEEQPQDLFLPVSSPSTAGSVMISNSAGIVSEVLLDGITAYLVK